MEDKKPDFSDKIKKPLPNTILNNDTTFIQLKGIDMVYGLRPTVHASYAWFNKDNTPFINPKNGKQFVHIDTSITISEMLPEDYTFYQNAKAT